MKGKGKIIILLVLALIAYKGYSNITDTSEVESYNDEYVEVVIPKGANTATIAKILKEEDLIKSEFAFKSNAKKLNVAGDFKAGKYKLSKSMDVFDIFDVITVALPEVEEDIVRVTIPEGFEITRIADRLEEKLGIDKAYFIELTENKNNFEDEFEFLRLLNDGQSLEGFLFPATYDIKQNEDEEKIIKMMLKAFDGVYNSDIKEQLNGRSLNEVITMASIVEREGKIDDERPIMAGVFYNRIQAGIPLGSCATVQYIIGERKPVLSKQDTKIDSPFNTYINKGLPPRPIAAPGRVSIRAALNPAETDYYYFVLTGQDGSHTFTRTLEEHNNAKKNMIRN